MIAKTSAHKKMRTPARAGNAQRAKKKNNFIDTIAQPGENVKTTAWKEAEHQQSQLTAKERGQLMLWAVHTGCPVTVHDRLDRYELHYQRVTEVRFLPTAPGLSVTVMDEQKNTNSPDGKDVSVDNAPEGVEMWGVVDLDPQKRDELLTAMRYGHTVTRAGEVFRRIEMFIFRLSESGKINATVKVRNYDDTESLFFPAEELTSTGRWLNR